MELTLSQELRVRADRVEKEYYESLPPEEREEMAEANAFLESFTKLVILSRESLVPNDFAQLDSLVLGQPAVIDRFLDQQYTLRLLDEVPGLVRRTLRLSHINARDTPSKQTNRYIREASRAFIMGLPLACVAMSRAALEQGLKERLGIQLKKEYVSLETLIDLAEQRHLLSASAGTAKVLARRCNRVLHQHPVKDEDAAFDVLNGIRSILVELFSGDHQPTN